MIELKANILSVEILKKADAICFTSNGMIKANGELVMGAGIAKAFRDRWPTLSEYFGKFVKNGGNTVHRLNVYDSLTDRYMDIASFPTKHHWRNPSDLALIKRSAEALLKMADDNKWKSIYLPRPGVGLGGLNWETQVKPVIKDILDDRFIICHL